MSLFWTSKQRQKFDTPAYRRWGGTRDLHIRAAGGDVRTGRAAVAERPAACRQRRDAAAATRDDAVEADKWVVRERWQRADVPGKSVAHPCRSASAADLVSSAVTCYLLLVG